MLIDVAVCGICGSDLHMYRHGGSPVAPEPLGHEFAGTVAEVGPDVDTERLPVGARVCVNPIYACGSCSRCARGWPHLCAAIRFHGCFSGRGGGLATRTVVSQEMAVPLPDAVSFGAGALVEPLAVGLHAVDMSEIGPGTRVVVVGAGPIGVSTALAARLAGIDDVLLIERSEQRRRRVGAMGLEVVEPDAARRVEADVAFECGGSSSSLAFAVDAVRAKGCVVIVAAHHGLLPLPAMPLLTSERRVVTSFAYAPGTFERVISLLADGAFPACDWTDRTSLDRVVADGFEPLQSGDRLKVLVDVS